MKAVILVLAGVLTLVGACSDSDTYDFRDTNRPAYNNAINVAELKALNANAAVTVLDVRLLEDYQANNTLIPGAVYRNPDEIETWASSLPEDSKVVVYCVAGRWVSQKAASYLADRGLETYTLTGGIEAWQSAETVEQED